MVDHKLETQSEGDLAENPGAPATGTPGAVGSGSAKNAAASKKAKPQLGNQRADTGPAFIQTDGSQPGDDEFDPELAEIEALTGEVFDERYLIIEELARGGMGIVFRAEHLALNRPVVIKVLKAAQFGSSTAKARFEREARRACQLDHPNVVTVHDFGYHGDLGYLVMEYVDGLTLYDYLKKYGPLAFAQFAPVAAAILSGLAEAHGQGIIHRDIKASNIMLTFEGDRLRRVKILDFGLAKVEGAEEDDVTKKSNLIGTMGAMPPERILCKPTDCRVDLYAFGVTAYRMISGRRPFVGEDMHVLYQHVHEHPPPLTELLANNHEYPLMVLEWVHRLLAKDPDDRPRDAAQAREWLLETLADKGVFRLDEGHVVWMEPSGSAPVPGFSGTYEATDPSWSINSNPTGSYRSVISEIENPAEVVAQLREEEDERVKNNALVTRVGVGLGVLAAVAVLAVGVVKLVESPPETAEVSATPAVAVKPATETGGATDAPPRDDGVELVFERIEADLEKGAYGNAENLLNSVRDKLAAETEYQVRAAEYQTRIDIDKYLRRARQAEKALKIEDAMKMYDSILSLDAGNAEAKKRHSDLAASVVIKVTSDPNGEVFVDGKSVGSTPLEKLVSSSFSKVEVRAKGYDTWSASLIPDGGTRVELSASPERKGRGSSNRRAQNKPPRDTNKKKKSTESISNENLMIMD